MRKNKNNYILAISILIIYSSIFMIIYTNIFSKSLIEKANADFSFTAPLVGDEVYLTQEYGLDKSAGGHNGIDFDQFPKPASIYAMADGEVTYANDGCPSNGDGCGGGMGNAVTVNMGDYSAEGKSGQLHYIYMHMLPSTITVKVGDKVKKVQKIGEMGHSGSSTAPHLHIGMWISNEPHYTPDTLVNPKSYIPMMPQTLQQKTKVEGTTFDLGKSESDSSKDDEKESKSNEGYSFNPFTQREARMNPLGLEGKQTEVSSDIMDRFYYSSKNIFNWAIPVFWGISALLITFATLIVILYLVAPIDAKGYSYSLLSKLTSEDILYDSGGKTKIIGIYLGVVAVCLVVMSGYYINLIGFLYQGVQFILELMMGVGGI